MKCYKTILILLLILLLLIIICIHNKEGFVTPKLYAMTFGGGGENYHDAVKRINTELQNIKIFDEIILYYDNDLKNDKEFWDKHKNFIENNKRGYGYYIWKPYLILKALERMNENDILLYIDAGCEVINNEKSYQQIKEFEKKCNEYNILYTFTGHNEKSYTKMDLFKYMKLDNDEIKNSMQYQTGLLFIKKNKKMIEFVKEWYNISCNYNLIDDSESIEPNDLTFNENRHDQSILSLLLKTDNYNVLNNVNNSIIYIDPFLFSRKRNG